MTLPLVINGITYNYPTVNDNQGWGPDATFWAQAVSVGLLQKSGGLFQLTNEVDFGTIFGLISLYYKSRSINVASAGEIRLAQSDVINFRNTANSDNLSLGVNGSDQLTFNGVPVVGAGLTVSDTDSIDLSIVTNVLSAALKLSLDSPPLLSQLVSLAIAADGLKASITNAAIQAAVDNTGIAVPVGAVLFWTSNTAPSASFMMCSGDAISRTTYSVLFSKIGTQFGEGDGSTTFNIPYVDGLFPRFTDNGSGRDPDAASRTASAAGGSTGDNVGSFQDENFLGHTHTQDAHTHSITDPGHNHTQNAHTHTITDPGHTHTQNPHSHSYTFGAGGILGSPSIISGNNTSSGTGTGIQNTTAVNQSNTTGITNANTTATNTANTTGVTANNTTATNQNTGGE